MSDHADQLALRLRAVDAWVVTRPGVFAAVAVCLSISACGDELTPYNQLEGLRVLAIAAEPAELVPTATTAISALVYRAPELPDPSFQWSWCPLTAGPNAGYACALTREELQAEVDRAIGPGVVEVPSFELGTTATVGFAHALSPAVLRGACDALGSRPLPRYVEPIDCKTSFPITLRLEATAGEKSVIAVKELRLLYDDSRAPNANPEINGANANLARRLEDPAMPVGGCFACELRVDVPAQFQRGQDYSISLKVDPTTSAERIDGVRERLVFTWFAEGAPTDLTRTSYVEGEYPIEDARANRWSAPLAVDYARPSARFYFIVRDDRGGTAWLTREVMLIEP
jgi:hypothetical protein